MVFVLIRSTDKKRVRLLDGSLTPCFEYVIQATKYASGKNIEHCEVKKVG
jgi:hypothetical protein